MNIAAIALLVGEPDARLRARWQDVFADVPGVEVCELGVAALERRPDVQCVVVTNWRAGEDWCRGLPVPDGVQFCSTASYHGWSDSPPTMPPYVVSIASFSAWQPAQHSPRAVAERNLALILDRLQQAN